MAWPVAWTRPAAGASSSPPSPGALPGPGADDPHEQAEYDREQAQFERTRRIPPSKLVK